MKIEDVWLDKLQVVRAPLPEPGSEPLVDLSVPPPADGSAPVAPPAPPLRLTLSGRLLDVANPSPRSAPRRVSAMQQLLASFTGSQFIASVENEKFDNNQNGLLRFDFTLVINPTKTL